MGYRFSLVEVIVAMVILALAFTMMGQAMQRGTDLSQRSREVTHAALFAQAKMEEILFVLQKSGPQSFTNEGVEANQFNDLYWTVQCEPLALSEGTLYNVQVAVRWDRKGQKQELVLNTRSRQ